MNSKFATIEERVGEIEGLIRDVRLGKASKDRIMAALKAAAGDLRGRQDGKPGSVLSELERKIGDAASTRGEQPDWSESSMIDIGKYVIGSWRTIRQALERLEQ